MIAKFPRCELFTWLPLFAFFAEYSIHALPDHCCRLGHYCPILSSGKSLIQVPFSGKGQPELELDREGILAQEEQEIVAKFSEDPKLGDNSTNDLWKIVEIQEHLLSTLAGLKVYCQLAPMFLVRDCTHGAPWAKSSLASRPFPLGLAKTRM